MPFEYSIPTATDSSDPGPVASVFGAGHLSELTLYALFDLVDAVLSETGRVERQPRSPLSRIGSNSCWPSGGFRISAMRGWASSPARYPALAARVAARLPGTTGCKECAVPRNWVVTGHLMSVDQA